MWCDLSEMPQRLLLYPSIRAYFLNLDRRTELPESSRISIGQECHMKMMEEFRGNGLHQRYIMMTQLNPF